tara:strand:- start:388 stop:567 length:180 start_codon:yes stop_codon:yes gene_type:complete
VIKMVNIVRTLFNLDKKEIKKRTVRSESDREKLKERFLKTQSLTLNSVESGGPIRSEEE